MSPESAKAATHPYTFTRARMARSASMIALGGACLVTAITLATTFFLTLNAVMTYVSGNWRSAEAQEAAVDLEPIMLLASADVARPSLADGSISPSETAAGRPAPHKTIPVVPRGRGLVSEHVLKLSTATEALPTESGDTGLESTTAEPTLVRQDVAKLSGEPSATLQASVDAPGTEQQRCGDGALLEPLCREAIRWAACHPDKWDTVPECSILKFDSSMQ